LSSLEGIIIWIVVLQVLFNTIMQLSVCDVFLRHCDVTITSIFYSITKHAYICINPYASKGLGKDAISRRCHSVPSKVFLNELVDNCSNY
jgi:hypothetical protein